MSLLEERMTAAELKRDKTRMKKVLAILKETYPDAECALHHKNAFELLAATILSAQCTDVMVNRVTPVLFAKYPDARALARAPQEEVEKIIRPTGFFKNKATSLKEMSKGLLERHGGEVPSTLEELTRLRGVGRKTANVVLGNAFGVPGLVVDTHVGRLCRRLGFTREEDPERVEHEMMEWVPKSDWTLFSHLLISHGRAICGARRPLCERCPLNDLCPKVGVPPSPQRPAGHKGRDPLPDRSRRKG
ncbi:MAG TPA: endonuclease III [Bdellovibrionota bacterium]|jgi:endonuclease-3|nr:endonuclease III [Bdellovibrionota bacterium]